MNKKIKLITNIILIIIIVILSIYVLLKITNIVDIYKVQTGSMEDGIHVGDYIIVLKHGEYKENDIVTFKKDNILITHRIIKAPFYDEESETWYVETKGDNAKDKDRVVTKGDANNTEDEGISKDSIVGKVIFKGGVLNFIINFKYVLVCLLLSLYLISYYFDKNNKKENEEKKI